MSGFFGTFWSGNLPKLSKIFHCGRKIRGLKTRFFMYISYINKSKSAPKAPKILGYFVPFQKKKLVMGGLETRGVLIITTDTVLQID